GDRGLVFDHEDPPVHGLRHYAPEPLPARATELDPVRLPDGHKLMPGFLFRSVPPWPITRHLWAISSSSSIGSPRSPISWNSSRTETSTRHRSPVSSRSSVGSWPRSGRRPTPSAIGRRPG